MVLLFQKVDVLKSCPHLLDRFLLQEEYEKPVKDMHGRIPYWASQQREIFHPSVSEYLYQIGHITPIYPQNNEFALCVTHDIDLIFKSIGQKMMDSLESLLRKDLSSFLYELLSFPNPKNPFYNFEEILLLEKEYGVRSTWFFQALEPGEPEFRYRLTDVSEAIKLITDAGGEIGLHGGFGTSENFELVEREKKRLEKILGKRVTGYRSHYLKFSVPHSWNILSEAGFEYDSTLGYTDCIGFRNGMCHPFKPINLKNQEYIDIIEIPLHVMEMSLFQHYMRLNIDEAFKLIREMIDAVHSCGGVFVVNWHNTGLLKESKERILFEKILGYCEENKAWMARADEIVKWVKNGFR